MTHDALEESVPLYAAGALDRIERQALEAHLLSGCASCHSALKNYQSIAALLPLARSGALDTHVARILRLKAAID